MPSRLLVLLLRALLALRCWHCRPRLRRLVVGRVRRGFWPRGGVMGFVGLRAVGWLVGSPRGLVPRRGLRASRSFPQGVGCPRAQRSEGPNAPQRAQARRPGAHKIKCSVHHIVALRPLRLRATASSTCSSPSGSGRRQVPRALHLRARPSSAVRFARGLSATSK